MYNFVFIHSLIRYIVFLYFFRTRDIELLKVGLMIFKSFSIVLVVLIYQISSKNVRVFYDVIENCVFLNY